MSSRGSSGRSSPTTVSGRRVLFYLISVLVAGIIGGIFTYYGTLLGARLVVGGMLCVGSLMALVGYGRLIWCRYSVPILLALNALLAFAILLIGVAFLLLAASQQLESPTTFGVSAFYGFFFSVAYIIFSLGAYVLFGSRRRGWLSAEFCVWWWR